MKFEIGVMPNWKSKPKRSTLDTDIEYQKLCHVITNNTLMPGQYAGVYINEVADAERLQAKNPARLVRDHLRRFLRGLNLEADYRIIARQTNQPGIWAVGVVLGPREALLSRKATARL
jgi:hypothetical protein